MNKKKKQSPEVYVQSSYSFEPPGAAEVEEDRVQEAINDVLGWLIEGSEYCFWATGRVFVIGFGDTEDIRGYRIIVVRNGYEEITITKIR